MLKLKGEREISPKQQWKFFQIFLMVMGVGSCILLSFLPYRPIEDRDYHPLVENKKVSSVFAWSPDGTKVVYQPEQYEPYEIRDLSTNAIIPLALPEGISIRALDWFSEEELAYISYSREATNYRVYLYNITEESLLKIWETDISLHQICWLPSEETFFILTDTVQTQFGNAILRYHASSGDFRPINTGKDSIDELACSHQQSKIAIVAHNNSDRTDNLYSIDVADAYNKVMLYETQRRIGGLSWSPNDDWIALQSSSRNYREILLVSADGSTTHELRNLPWSETVPAEVKWSPVENTFLVRNRSGQRLNITYSLALYDFTPPETPLEE